MALFPNNTTEYNIDYFLDLTGLFCPEPLMLVHKQVKIMQPGEILQIVATDPATRRDIPNFCRFLNYQLLLNKQVDDQFIYHLSIEN